MRYADEIRRDLGSRFAAIGACLAEDSNAEVTIVCVPRHGHATTRTTIESLSISTGVPFRLVVVDVASPASVQRYLEAEAHARSDLIHVRIDELVSRQTARLLVRDLIRTPYTVLVDNNMLFRSGWLEALLVCVKETGAAMVSPVIVTQGGHIHFSGGFVVPHDGVTVRPHAQKGGPVNAQIESAQLKRLDIDFAESHCCLARTECLLRQDVMMEAMHNAQTLCYAAYLLKHRYGERIVIEPEAIVALLPISFGYDIPWMCESYMDRELLRGSYEHLTALIGEGPSQNPETGFEWHAMHFKYLLLTMLENDRLNRSDLLRTEEVPGFVTGYDRPLPKDHMRQINDRILPYVRQHHANLLPQMAQWLDLAPLDNREPAQQVL
jgi:hypothetical protein